MGLFKLGSLIKFIPYTITTGFTTGIAITLVIGQLKDFLGLTFTESPIETIVKTCKKNGSTLVLSHVNEQPMEVFKKSGMYGEIGEENFCENIDAALERAKNILK